MPTIVNTIATSYRGRHHQSDDSDPIYGDFEITAPLGHPTGNDVLYLKERGHESAGADYHQSSNRIDLGLQNCKLAELPMQRNPIRVNQYPFTESKSSTQRSSERTRERSRSQSGIPDGRSAHPDHRMRSSSSNRSAIPRQEHHSGSAKAVTLPEPRETDVLIKHGFQRQEIRNPNGTSTGLSAGQELRRLGHGQNRVKHSRSSSDIHQHKVLQQSYSSLNQKLERSTSPALTILSPVSETFGTDGQCQPMIDGRRSLDSTRPTAHPLAEKHDHLVASNSQLHLGGPGITRNRSPQPQMLTFKHGEQFINPLAAHSTISTRNHISPQLAQGTQHWPTAALQADRRQTDKTMPTCHTSSFRSLPLECTAFAQDSGKAVLGLETTSMMRPSSRNKHGSTYPQLHKIQTRSHMRGTSLNQVLDSLAHTKPRKEPHTEESQGYTPSSQPSSAGSDLTTGSNSTQSTSYIPTPKDSSAQTQARNINMSPSLAPTSDRRSFEHIVDNHISTIAIRITPSPGPSSKSTTNTVGGNIYNEIRDDLAFVARDLNEITLAAQRERATKFSKLRSRARSASRSDRRSDRRHRDNENTSGNFTYREMNRSELVGGWGNAAFVPAYDLPDTRDLNHEHVDLKDQNGCANFRTDRVEIVPEYEELWG